VTTKPEITEFAEPEWRTWKECACLDENSQLAMMDSRDPCWTTVLRIPVSSTKSLPPGYQSIYSATNHTLNVKVKVKNSQHEALELEVPLQVVNDPSIVVRETLNATSFGHAAPVMLNNGFGMETQVNGKGFSFAATSSENSVMAL